MSSKPLDHKIVSPATDNRSWNPADVLHSTYTTNVRKSEEDEDAEGEADADAEPDGEGLYSAPIYIAPLSPTVPRQGSHSESPQVQIGASSSSSLPTATTPCDRCVRTGRLCKGPVGARCEYCKRLKQKCTNSTGPARGKSSLRNLGKQAKATTSQQSSGLKRNLSQLQHANASSHPGESDGHSIDGEGSIDIEGGHLAKKRRVTNAISRSELVKIVGDLEASVNRIQSAVSKEVNRMTGMIQTLNRKIKDMDEDQ